jgi:alpha-tubulin suppressor-like RCC1 family protein
VVPPVLGLGDNEGRTIPERLTSLDLESGSSASSKEKSGSDGMSTGVRIVKIACGWDHCLALDDQGVVRVWGSGQNGKLGRGNEENVSVPTVVTALLGTKIVSISAGCEHSVAVTAEGVMYSWGHGDGGRLGHGDHNQCLIPAPVYALGLMNIRYELIIVDDLQ